MANCRRLKEKSEQFGIVGRSITCNNQWRYWTVLSVRRSGRLKRVLGCFPTAVAIPIISPFHLTGPISELNFCVIMMVWGPDHCFEHKFHHIKQLKIQFFDLSLFLSIGSHNEVRAGKERRVLHKRRRQRQEYLITLSCQVPLFLLSHWFCEFYICSTNKLELINSVSLNLNQVEV